MAGEVGLQSDVYLEGAAKPRTLHLKTLRRQWQIIALQIVATIALIGMYLEVVSTYVVNSIDHTMVFDYVELLISDQLPLGDWLTGEGRTGMARFFVPLVLGLALGGVMAFIAFQSPKVQQRIKLGVIVALIVLLVGRLVLSWFAGMLFSFELRLPNEGELQTLQVPLLMIMSLLILFIYLLPVIMGTRGIWGLSRRSIAWAIGFTLLFLGIHAILTFPLIKSQLGDAGGDAGHAGKSDIGPHHRSVWIETRHAGTVQPHSHRRAHHGFPGSQLWRHSQPRVRLPSTRVVQARPRVRSPDGQRAQHPSSPHLPLPRAHRGWPPWSPLASTRCS